MNRRAECDAASSIIDGEIRNHYPHLVYRHVFITSVLCQVVNDLSKAPSTPATIYCRMLQVEQFLGQSRKLLSRNKNGNNVEATFDFVDRIARLVAFDIVAGVNRA